MPDRHYSDDETAEIFRRATESDAAPPARGNTPAGFSLQQLQEIGREAGISEESVALAARSLDHVAVGRTSRMLGLPFGVGDSADLERRLSDAEWDALVIAARDTFQATGKLRNEGSFRQWSNGNLQMLLEPAERGHRLTFRTTNANLLAQMIGGGASLALGSLMITLGIIGPGSTTSGLLTGGSIIAVAGVTFLASAFARLPTWARRRQEQFRALIARAHR